VFVTDYGYTYTVYFDFDSGIFPHEELDEYAVYMGFNCVPRQEKFDRIHDPRIGATVMRIVANMFLFNPWYLVSYVCSAQDGQARQRFIAFGKWYGDSPMEKKIGHFRRNYNGTYCGVLYSKKHPLIDELEIAFQDLNPGDKFGSGVAEPEPYYSFEEDEEMFDL
jgi:hypothetical protein